MKSYLGGGGGICHSYTVACHIRQILITARCSSVYIFVISVAVNVFVIMMLTPFHVDSLPLVVDWKTCARTLCTVSQLLLTMSPVQPVPQGPLMSKMISNYFYLTLVLRSEDDFG